MQRGFSPQNKQDLRQSANDRVAIGPCSAAAASSSTGGLQEFLLCVCSFSCLPTGVTQDCTARSAGRRARVLPRFYGISYLLH